MMHSASLAGFVGRPKFCCCHSVLAFPLDAEWFLSVWPSRPSGHCPTLVRMKASTCQPHASHASSPPFSVCWRGGTAADHADVIGTSAVYWPTGTDVTSLNSKGRTRPVLAEPGGTKDRGKREKGTWETWGNGGNGGNGRRRHLRRSSMRSLYRYIRSSTPSTDDYCVHTSVAVLYEYRSIDDICIIT